MLKKIINPSKIADFIIFCLAFSAAKLLTNSLGFTILGAIAFITIAVAVEVLLALVWALISEKLEKSE
jgi:hypothetical protein